MAAKLKIESDTSALQRDYDRLLRENAKQREALYKLNKAGEDVAKSVGMSMRQLRSFADQTSRAMLTPAQQYRQELEKLRAAKKADLLTESQYQQAKQQTKQRIRENTDEYKAQRAEQERLRRIAQQAATAVLTDAERQRAKLRDLRDAWQAGHLSAEQYRRAVQQVRDESNRMNKTAGPGLANIAQQLRGMVTGVVGLGAIVSSIRAAMAEAQQLRDEVYGKQVTVGQAQAQMMAMLGPVSETEAQRFSQQVDGVATETRFADQATLYGAAGDILSATAGNQEMTVEILRQVAPIMRQQPAQLAEFGGAVADLATIQGAETDEEIKAVISTVLATLGQARITSLGAFKEAAAAVAGATQLDTGEDRSRAIREAGAAFAAIGGAIKDPTGSLTKTATAELAKQLETLLPEKDVLRSVSDEQQAALELRREELLAKRDEQLDEDATPAQIRVTANQLAQVNDELAGIVRRGTGLRTLAERVAAVQADEDLQRTFLQGDASRGITPASFRGPITPVISSMMTDTESEPAQRFTEAMEAISSDPRFYDQLRRNIEGATAQTQRADRASGRATAVSDFEQQQLRAADRAEVEAAYADVRRLARPTGMRAGLDWMEERGGRVGRHMLDDDEAIEEMIRDMVSMRARRAGMHMDPQRRDLMGEGYREILQQFGSQADRERVAGLPADTRAQIQLIDTTLDELRGVLPGGEGRLGEAAQTPEVMQRIAEACEASAHAAEETSDAIKNRPLVGSTTAAANGVSQSQRQGR
jgi:hypothetical protein